MLSLVQSGSEFKKLDHAVPAIAGCLLLVSTVLPWISFAMMSFNAFSVSGAVATFGILGAIIALGSSALQSSVQRAISQIASGVVALLSLLGMGSNPEIAAATASAANTNYQVGFYLFVVVALVLIGFGVWTYSKSS